MARATSSLPVPVSPTISALHGQVLGFQANPGVAGWEVFNALLPAVARDELHRSLASATRGTGWAVISFDHYDEVRPGHGHKG